MKKTFWLNKLHVDFIEKLLEKTKKKNVNRKIYYFDYAYRIKFKHYTDEIVKDYFYVFIWKDASGDILGATARVIMKKNLLDIRKDFQDFEAYLNKCNDNLHKTFCEWLSKGRTIAAVEIIQSWIEKRSINEIKELLPIVYEAIDKSISQ